MRLGIGSYTFTWSIGVPGHATPPNSLTALGLLDEAKRLGVRVVQLCDNLPLTRLTSAELDGFESRLAANGLELELGTRGLEPDQLRRHLELARRFRCKFLRVVVDRPGDEPAPSEAVERLGVLMPEFDAAGVKIAIENHDRFRSRTLAWMVEQLGPHRAGICLDTVNSFGALEGPDVVVANLGRHTLCLHAKDFTVRRVGHAMGFVVEGCAAGQGRLDVPWLLRELQVSPHSFNVILETWVTPGASAEETVERERLWTEEGVRYLRTLVTD